MKIKYAINGLLLIAMFALPAVSLANTYQYIDTSGNLRIMEAANSSIALATAYQLGTHSGVMLVSKTSSVSVSTNTNTGSGNYYQYIDTSGNLQGLWAANSSIALATAYQLGTHSGVMLVK